MKDCENFLEVTGRRVTFEYTLLAGVNDSAAQVSKAFPLLTYTEGLRLQPKAHNLKPAKCMSACRISQTRDACLNEGLQIARESTCLHESCSNIEVMHIPDV